MNDLAVIRLDDPPSGLRPATFADSKTVRAGQIVLAMGNPLGLPSSVTQGGATCRHSLTCACGKSAVDH